MKIKKNDIVQIIQGKDAGKKGKVLRAMPKINKIVVEGLNLVVKHVRPRREGEKGQRVKMAMPLDASNAMLICPRCKKKIRVGYKTLTDGPRTTSPLAKSKVGGRKQRLCRKCNDVFK